MKLSNIIPEARDLLSMEAEEIAGVLIEFIATNPEIARKGLHPSNVFSATELSGYPKEVETECELACAEGWSVLLCEGVLVAKPDQHHGICFLSRKGKGLRSRADFSAFRKSRLLPRESVHQILQSETYNLFIRGQYETAVFNAFKAVEVRVRDACPALSAKIGVDLVVKAFNPSGGPLTDTAEDPGEQQALMSLFAGAIGRFKNPSSHRHVPFANPAEAIEAILLASHLLRIVEERAKKVTP